MRAIQAAEGVGMKSDFSRGYLAGAVYGGGLTLFALYVVSHAFTITLLGWSRIALGVVGLALWLAGGLMGRRFSPKGRPDA